MDDKLKEVANRIKNQIDYLNQTKSAACWICGEEIKNWICLLPANGTDDLGFGTNEGKMRIAFIPVCKKHNLEDEEIIKELRHKLQIKAQTLKN